MPEILLHVSRGVRWDSDHVVILNDDLEAIAQELVRGDYLGRTHIGLDYFDASINRVAAWIIGARNMLKALLKALLEPIDRLRAAEQPATTPGASRCSKRRRRCRSARCGTTTASAPVCRSARRGWTTSAATSATCCRCGSERTG